MVTEAERAVEASEQRLRKMANRIAERFQPERVYLIGGRVTGQGEWVEVDLLVVLNGDWDYREKSIEIASALSGSGIGHFIYVSTPERLERCDEVGDMMEHGALNGGRVLYERR